MLVLHERIDALNGVKKDGAGLDYYDFVRWCSKTRQVADRIFGQDNPQWEELRTLALANCSCNASRQALVMAEEYHAGCLRSLRRSVQGSRCNQHGQTRTTSCNGAM